MEVIRLEELEPELNPRGVMARELVNSSDVHVMNLLLKPGETVDTHTTPVDVFFYVVGGRGRVVIGEEEEQVTATDLVVSPKNMPRALHAGEDEKFHVLVVKTPNPKKT